MLSQNHQDYGYIKQKRDMPKKQKLSAFLFLRFTFSKHTYASMERLLGIMPLEQYACIIWVYYDTSCRISNFLWHTHVYITNPFMDDVSETIYQYNKGPLW